MAVAIVKVDLELIFFLRTQRANQKNGQTMTMDNKKKGKGSIKSHKRHILTHLRRSDLLYCKEEQTTLSTRRWHRFQHEQLQKNHNKHTNTFTTIVANLPLRQVTLEQRVDDDRLRNEICMWVLAGVSSVTFSRVANRMGNFRIFRFWSTK